MSRRKARILAVQALYSYEIGGADLDSLLTLDWVDQPQLEFGKADESGVNEDERSTEKFDFARILIAGTINHIKEIDSAIKCHLSERWDSSWILTRIW